MQWLRSPMLAATAAGLAVFAAGATLTALDTLRVRDQAHSNAELALVDHANTLDRVIRDRVRQARGLALFARENPELDQPAFDRAARGLLGGDGAVVGAMILDDATITHASVTFLSATLAEGLDLTELIGQQLSADDLGDTGLSSLEAILSERDVSVLGPFTQDLPVNVLIAAQPVDPIEATRQRIALVVLDFPELLREAGVDRDGHTIDTDLLVRLDVPTAIAEDFSLVDHSPVDGLAGTSPSLSADVPLPNAPWSLHGEPANPLPTLTPQWLLILTPTAIGAVLAIWLVRSRRREADRLEQRVAEATDALASETARSRATFEHAPDGILDVGPTTLVERANPAAAALLGTTTEELAGTPLSDLFPLVTHETAPHATHVAERRVGGDLRTFEVSHARWTTEAAAGRSVIFRDITEQRRSQDVLRLYTAELEEVSGRRKEVDQIRNDLVSMVSHEIRTPMTAIKGFTELLEDRLDEMSGEDLRRSLHALRRHADRMWMLISDLLRAAQIEDEPISDGSEHCSVREAVEPLVAGDGPPIDLVGDATIAAPVADVGAVLRGLVTNAVKYGAAPIRVVVTTDGDDVVIDVEDHGPGVPPDFLPRLFEPFSQASRGDQRTAAGMGVGLSLSRSIARLHGGDVTLRRSVGPTVFRVTLPRSRDEVVPTALVGERSD